MKNYLNTASLMAIHNLNQNMVSWYLLINVVCALDGNKIIVFKTEQCANKII
jgi:hypothetical protein